MAESLSSGKIEEQARSLAEPLLCEAGYSLWDVIFEKEGAMRYLRVLFDKEHDLKTESGITSEECEKMTAPLNAVFDRQKFIENVDILEIGSPGLTRRLRRSEHFAACHNLCIRAVIRGEKGKTEAIYGVLERYDENADTITVKTATGTDSAAGFTELEIKKCIRINLDL